MNHAKNTEHDTFNHISKIIENSKWKEMINKSTKENKMKNMLGGLFRKLHTNSKAKTC